MKCYLFSRKHLVVLLVLLGMVALLGIGIFLYHSIETPLLSTNASNQTIKVYKGDQLGSVVRRLETRHLLKHPWIFILYTRWRHLDRSLKVGEYTIEAGMTFPQLIQNIIQRKVVIHTIQFIEGWTFLQFKKNIQRHRTLRHTLTRSSDKKIMNRLQSQYQSPEGLFFPDTYAYTGGDSDLDILKRAYDRMQAVFDFEWLHRKAALPYHNKYEALIVASLIETEARFDDERTKIAGVIIRRLNKWMPLQIDATINYGLGYPYGHKLTKADLRKNTPYNTYLHYRLPPTPICMPGRKSIYAALHPDNRDTLYYVAKGDGRHVFSKNYAGQEKAVERYQVKSDET